MGSLNEECHGLRDDLQRQQALVSYKLGMIAELRDEACTLWASEWLTFWLKASKVFLGLSFNFLVPVEDEVGESDSDEEDGLGVSLTVPSSVLLLGGPWLRLPKLWLPILRLFPVIFFCSSSLRLL